jgi:hypothetical protein
LNLPLPPDVVARGSRSARTGQPPNSCSPGRTDNPASIRAHATTRQVNESDTALNIRAGLDRVWAISSAAERRTRSDDLVEQIENALATAGEYVTRIDLLPTQHVVDFNWAAHQAGRRLGIRIQVDVKVSKAAPDGRSEVRVGRQPPPD